MPRGFRVILGPDWGSWGLLGPFADTVRFPICTCVFRWFCDFQVIQIHDPIAICSTCALPRYTSRSSDPRFDRYLRYLRTYTLYVQILRSSRFGCSSCRFGLPWPQHQSSCRSGLPHAASAFLTQLRPSVAPAQSSCRFGLPWPQHQSSRRFGLPHADSDFRGPSTSPHADSAFRGSSKSPSRRFGLLDAVTQIRRFVNPVPVLMQIRPSRCGHADSVFCGPCTSPLADSVFSMWLHRTTTYQRNSHGDRSGDKLLTENVMN